MIEMIQNVVVAPRKFSLRVKQKQALSIRIDVMIAVVISISVLSGKY